MILYIITLRVGGGWRGQWQMKTSLKGRLNTLYYHLIRMGYGVTIIGYGIGYRYNEIPLQLGGGFRLGGRAPGIFW